MHNRQRVHANAFLIHVFKLMHRYSQLTQNERSTANAIHPLDFVCDKLIGGRRLMFLCFDELQLSDVSEAVILKGLFERLLNRGIIALITGNREPSAISGSQLNATAFNGFLEMLERHCHFINVTSAVDYRSHEHQQSHHASPHQSANALQQKLQQTNGYPLYVAEYITNVKSVYNQTLDTLMQLEREQLGNAAPASIESRTIPVAQGRQLHIAQTYGGIAMMSFNDLCAQRLGSSDYLALAQHFHTICIPYIARFTVQERDQLRRYIWLIDQLYNHHCKMVAVLATSPEQLFQTASMQQGLGAVSSQETDYSAIMAGAEGSQYEGEVAKLNTGSFNRYLNSQLWSGADEKFAYARSASRLNEMKGRRYLAQPHQPNASMFAADT